MFNLLNTVSCIEYNQHSIEHDHLLIKNYYVEYDDMMIKYSDKMNTRSLTVKENEIILNNNDLIYTGDFNGIEDVSMNILHMVNESVSQSLECEFYDTPFSSYIILKYHKLLSKIRMDNTKVCVIVPSVELYDVFYGHINADIYLNDTGFYKDNVFVFNSHSEVSVPYLGLVTTKLIPDIRGLKIMKLCNKFSTLEHRFFKYGIIPFSEDYKKHFGVINLY